MEGKGKEELKNKSFFKRSPGKSLQGERMSKGVEGEEQSKQRDGVGLLQKFYG